MTHVLEVDEGIAHTCEIRLEQANDGKEKVFLTCSCSRSLGTHCQLWHQSVEQQRTYQYADT